MDRFRQVRTGSGKVVNASQSHEALHIPHCYGVSELQALTRQLGNVKRASHRPKAVRPSNQMQPHDDEEELPELQYVDEDLLEVPAIC